MKNNQNNMFPKIILFLLLIMVLSPRSLAQAGVLINEIMYDLEESDEGGEWVEIYNDRQEEIDLSEYRFFEADTNHKLVLAQGSPKLEPFQYILVVSNFEKFKIFYPNFGGNVFDSSFMLSNIGESIALKDKDLNIVNQISYSKNMGGNGNGRTISKIGDIWKEGKPTPGASNQVYVPPVVNTSLPKPKAVSFPQKTSISEKIEVPTNPLNTITASTIESDIPKNNSNNSFLFTIFFIVFVGMSAGAVYLIRQKKIAIKAGDDFKIFE